MTRAEPDRIGQESRSIGRGGAHSVLDMDLTIHARFLPHIDPDASVATSIFRPLPAAGPRRRDRALRAPVGNLVRIQELS